MRRQFFGFPLALEWPKIAVDPEALRHGAWTAVWVRLVVLVLILGLVNHRIDYGSTLHFQYLSMTLVPASVFGACLYLLWRKRKLPPGVMLLFHGIDLAVVATGVAMSGGFGSPLVGLYYPYVAVFAAVFPSALMTFSWVTLVVATYTGVCVLTGTSVDLGAQVEAKIITQVLAMYGVAMAVVLVARFDRERRLDAVEHQQELETERIEMSRNIHDTIAQTAYLIRLGIEVAMRNPERLPPSHLARLEALHHLSKSTVWELRHPINGGLVFQGYDLVSALQQHARTFTAFSGVPADVTHDGREPPLPAITRSRLFSIAHNAMTNAFSHAQANQVSVHLAFTADHVRLSVSDDGIGLPEDYDHLGHGFNNMKADAGRIGALLQVQSNGETAGTTVTCVLKWQEG
ncbi:MAG: histidine kinase [Chloroflexi bacterium]|nr:histidine kinase [Chloroflexota bacterium]